MSYNQSISDPLSRSMIGEECRSRKEVLMEAAGAICYRCADKSAPHYISGKDWEHPGGWGCSASAIHDLISEIPSIDAPLISRFIYESWGPDLSTPDVFCPPTNVASVAEPGDIFRYRVYASTWEEGCAIYHLREGWEPYLPEGKAVPCPKECGANYYPEGSGDCRNCGHII